MGVEPGRVMAEPGDPEFAHKNYAFGPAAKVENRTTAPRKLTNHMFVGPDYSVLPPYLFPFNVQAIREEHEKSDPTARGAATIRDWLLFDYEAGWGTLDFEDLVGENHDFPDRWDSIDLGIVGIGAYEPASIMKPVHTTPEEAVQIGRDMKGQSKVRLRKSLI